MACLLSSCNKELLLTQPSFHSDHSNSDTCIILYERDPRFPVTDYKALQESILTQLSTEPVTSDIEDYVGHSYMTMYYPIEDARNLGRAVIDMNSYTNDYLGRYEKIPINQSFATSYSYKDFNRLSEKTEISSKVNVETNSNILNVFSHSSKSSFEEVFGESFSSNEQTVYGESSIRFYSERYDLSLPSNLYDRIIDKYLSPVFLEFLYNSTPDELFDNFGCFVLSKLISGGCATALYQATSNSDMSVYEMESSMDNLISASVGIGNTSVGVGFGNTNFGSSSDSILHNFNEALFSVHTYGGTATYNQFTPPKDVNDIYFNLSDWSKSLTDNTTHTIADIPDKALIPLYEFIEEDNLKNEFIDIMGRGYSYNVSMQEPYISIDVLPMIDPKRNYIIRITATLRTRYNEYIDLLSSQEVVNPEQSDIDKFVTLQKARLKKQFPGILINYARYEIPKKGNPSQNGEIFEEPETIKPSKFKADTTEGFNLFYMKKYQNPDNGKIYLISNNDNVSTIYTIYGDEAINDYTFSIILDAMDTMNTHDFELKVGTSRLVAL